jgi:hypothetical protein
MSSFSEQDHLNPNGLSYYAPRWLRERLEPPLSPSLETRAEPIRGPIFHPASLNIQLENAVSDALWHPLDPEVFHEPPGFAHEGDQRKALISVVGRFAAAVGVSAILALFFVIMIPVSRDPDGSGSSISGLMQSMITAASQTPRKDDGLASTRTSQPAITHEQSKTLLQQLLQWRQKANPTETPR